MVSCLNDSVCDRSPGAHEEVEHAEQRPHETRRGQGEGEVQRDQGEGGAKSQRGKGEVDPGQARVLGCEKGGKGMRAPVKVLWLIQ